MSEHDRFEELASLAALGEISPQEYGEFRRHAKSCRQCRELVATTSSVAASAFLAGVSGHEDPAVEVQRHRRMRAALIQHMFHTALSYTRTHKRWVTAGIAASFLFGIVLGASVIGVKGNKIIQEKASANISSNGPVNTVALSASAQTDNEHLQMLVANMQKEIGATSGENQALREKLAASDEGKDGLQKKLDGLVQQATIQARELEQTRGDLNVARNEVSQTRESISSRDATLDSLRFKLTEQEERLNEATANLDREREMLSAGREIRDIMGARDLHLVDVVDIDGKGHTKKVFGRAFYTQGKSLIFYAFDLPTKNTTDGKFVYAAWGSNSSKTGGQAPHSLGIFYNDDQAQRRWAMKFEDPKILDEIDTVFITLEPSGRSFLKPTGKPILEAYFGTPPNHP